MGMGQKVIVVGALLGIVFGGCGSDDADGSPAPTMDAAPEEDAGTDGSDLSDPPDTAKRGVIRGSARLFGIDNHEGIEVRLEGTTLTTTTSTTGEFQLDDVPAGVVTLSASYPKYQVERFDVAVEHGKTSSMDPIILRLGKLLHAGENCIPLGFSPSGEHALYADDFSPFLGTGTLFAHDIQEDTAIEAGSSIAIMAVMTSHDGRFLAAIRNMAVSSGVGELVGVDLGSGEVRSFSKSAYAGGFAFTQDSQFLVYLADLDMSDESAELHVVSTTDWTDRLLAANVALGSIEEPEGQGTLWFSTNVSYTNMSGDLYRYEFGAAEAEKVDSDVLVGMRWLGGVGQPTVYVKQVKDHATGTLAAWESGESPRTLANSVLFTTVHARGDETELVFVSDYVLATNNGNLRRWIVGSPSPTTVASDVDGSPSLSWDGSKLVYIRDFDNTTYEGTLAVWDFDTAMSHDLGTSAAPWSISDNGKRIASFSIFDEVTQLGDLHVFDFATDQSTLVATDASPNVIDFDPTGTWLAFQVNPIQDTFQGDLWIHDTSTGQNTLLALSALPVTWWSASTPMVGYFADPDDEFVTANLSVHALDSGKSVSFGRALFMTDTLLFGPSGSWVSFYRNPSMAEWSGDLWVWDGEVDPWEGTDLGIEVKKNVGFWAVGVLPEGLMLMSDLSPMWGSGTLSWWSRTIRKTTVLGEEVNPNAWVLSPDRSQVVFFANAKGQPMGDLFYADLEEPKPELLGPAVHMQGVWLDEAWTRMVFVANTVGDVGEVVAKDLIDGTSRVLGTSAPFFGLAVSPDGTMLSFLHEWDTAKTIGTLSALVLDDTAAQPVPYDDFAPLTYLMSNDHLLYVVMSKERSGVYLAPSPAALSSIEPK